MSKSEREIKEMIEAMGPELLLQLTHVPSPPCDPRLDAIMGEGPQDAILGSIPFDSLRAYSWE